ncbi:GspE/PulE family protein [Sphingomonas montanisoli]|uniref:General secretion pathway protein E n=1 Tax=Sphingomonas montanisoli TaxID=2606412 RepID=A0A5D9CCI7_9SPHN|nr:ATPase, T2SS/T4P/T4SS family [Sphingomonas montanisoli]TZG29047.1 type II secretion system protein GspE [Sphingomonas montanisoli]
MSDLAEDVAVPAPLAPAIPYAFAKRAGLVPLGTADTHGRPLIGLRPDADRSALIELRRAMGRAIAVEPLAADRFEQALSDHYAMDGQAAALLGGAIGLDDLGELPSSEDLLDSADDAPAIRLINGIIADAVRQGVSDIHVEPFETGLVVRMRIDGVLSERLRLPAAVAPVVVSRIKVMSRLDIAERRLPQDGRIGLSIGGRLLDVRVSTLPGRAGERVVLRILDKEAAGIDPDQLGMPPAVDRAFRAALAEPNGILLVTGPTGAGKTTTLYAALRSLNDGSRNILTVEDPIEYAVDGVGQTQVNPKVGLDFAAGLRAILRQDPDVVMVGEIRDGETAQIATQASLTGHLVLSTLHTNDAVGAITRLRDMKVEPFLIASTVRAVIAQRLVRRLCPVCSIADTPSPAIRAALKLKRDPSVRVAQGCEACGHTGYRGRIGLFEVIRIDDTIRAIINADGDEVAIAKHAFATGDTLAKAARRLVREGVTSPEEALRIIRGDGADE